MPPVPLAAAQQSDSSSGTCLEGACQESVASEAPAKALPACPVRLFSHDEEPCVRRLQVLSVDQVGLLFKLCELLTSHGIDIVSADVRTEDGIVDNRFELHTSRPSDFSDASEWCKELENFIARNHATHGSVLKESLAAASKRLSVNPDLLSVLSFQRIQDHDGGPSELRYSLELEGINQAGLLTYTALVFYRSGFSVTQATISTVEGHVSDTFELSTTSNEAEHLLRSYLDVPYAGRKNTVPLPFHVSPSDGNLEELMNMWGKSSRTTSPRGSPGVSRAPSFTEDRASSLNEDDVEISRPRGRLPSSMSDREEPTGKPGPMRKRSSGDLLEALSRSSSELAGPSAPGGAPSGDVRKRESRRMSVHFANGDVYTGNCVLFEGGEKRHGLGTYIYSPGTHETYKQYRGQWREDKKDGYGVLFYRNGGVYVGQWLNNQKHGLGVLLDHTGMGECDAAQMPTFRYEGQWFEDEPHGLGAEENDLSAYFGHFVHGKRQGRGVRMNLAKMGSAGCEVMDSAGRAVPLLDALEAEMAARARAPRGSGSTEGREGRDPRDMRDLRDLCDMRDMPEVPATFHFSNSQEAEVRPSLASVAFTPQDCRTSLPRDAGNSKRSAMRGGSSSPSPAEGLPWAAPARASGTAGASENESGSSGKTSGETRSPASARVNWQVRADLTTPSENQATPGMGAGMKSAHQGLASWSLGSPSDAQQTPLLTRQEGVGQAAMPFSRERTRSGRSASSDTHAGQGVQEGGSGSVVFSLWEENNLLSPPDTTLGGLIPEEAARQTAGDDSRGAGGGGATREPALERRMTGPKATVSDPTLPSAPAPVVSPHSAGLGSLPQVPVGVAAAAEVLGSGGNGPPSDPRLGGSYQTGHKKDSRPQRVRTPLLWSEDELAAFIACLGVGPEVCGRVQQRKLKGAVRLLEMTNSELRREFGLTSPVERLTVRQSLKRLLDADRWENSVRGHKVGDILSDSVLSPFIVPLEELTLVTKISQGGYGTVYRGVLVPSVERGHLQANTSHLVAVKEMRGERRVRLYELLKEACVMASLKHPNICTFIGVCANAAARKHYIISELMDCSLFDLIHQPYKLRWHGELTVSLVLNLSKAICDGVVYIHGRNLVHADLKSSNILIDYSTSWQLVPRICDFGHAAVRTFPSPHHRCGTPHWAGPEVLRSEALGPAADVYSFGVIMWEMLAQKLPHKGLSFGQVLASVGWAGWTPDPSLLPEIPHELRRLLRECLSFSPSDRPTSKDAQRRLRRIPKQARLKALKMLMAFLW